jgi:hypothetical protein
MRAILVVGLIFSSFSVSYCQSKEIEQQQQFWMQYTFLGKISNRWSLYFDYVDRANDLFRSQNTIFFRPGVAFDLNADASVYAGYCYAVTFEDERTPVKLIEHRPWQQLLINNKLGKFSIQHRYRLEERFNQTYKDGQIVPGYTFSFRFRYKLNVQYPILKISDKHSLSVLFTDELITSFGKNVGLNYFNQNRAFIGVSIPLSHSLSTSFGYTNIFRSTSTPMHYLDINAPTINVNHKIDFRKVSK